MDSIPEHQPKMQALDQLKQYHQWVNYIFVSRGGRITKPPINPHVPTVPVNRPKERLASATNPATWSSYETAVARWKASNYKGIGFVFTSHDCFCGIDLDHCRDPKNGEIAAWAQRILWHLNSYSEASALSTGVHIYIQASLLETKRVLGLSELPHKKGNTEVYDRERYFTWSGNHITGTPSSILERQDEINELYFQLFLKGEESPTSTKGWIDSKPTQGVSLPNDAALIELAEKARGHNGLLFSQLWRGDLAGYTKPGSNEPDYSRADLALCSILAYWTQKDTVRIDRLFRRSALYIPQERKEKWDRPARGGETYGAGTIRVAIEHCHYVYNPSWRPPGWIDYTQQDDDHSDKMRKQLFPHHNADQQGQKGRDA